MLTLTSYLKLVTQTDRIPASAAARHATGTTSETCFHENTNKHQIKAYLQMGQQSQYTSNVMKKGRHSSRKYILTTQQYLIMYCSRPFQVPFQNNQNADPNICHKTNQHIITTKSGLMEFNHSTSASKMEARGTTAVSEYQFNQ